MTNIENLKRVVDAVDSAACQVGNLSLELKMHVGLHVFRLGFDRLIEARSLFAVAARLEEANE
jgi:hypothetical protein